MAGFSYARFSSSAVDCVMATSAPAYEDGVPAERRHLRRALKSSPSVNVWERHSNGRPGRGSVYSVFTVELRRVLERAPRLTDRPVETIHLAAALDS